MMDHTIITIGRQFGSGGRDVGEKVAEYFNIPFYDKELVELAAQKSKRSWNFERRCWKSR